jgi:hypothetical protein
MYNISAIVISGIITGIVLLILSIYLLFVPTRPLYVSWYDRSIFVHQSGEENLPYALAGLGVSVALVVLGVVLARRPGLVDTLQGSLITFGLCLIAGWLAAFSVFITMD